MRTGLVLVAGAVALAGLVACAGGAGAPPPAECSADEQCPAQRYCSPAGACTAFASPGVDCRRQVDCAAGQACRSNACVTPTPECDLAENLARRSAILAAQPALRVGGGPGHAVVRTGSVGWASLSGDASVWCAVDVQYRDASGDGALQPYEDWTRSAAERTADLVARLAPAQRLALMLQPALADAPAGTDPPSAATLALVDGGVRYGLTAASTSSPTARAAWANALQERCEAAAWGIPFVLASEPAHTTGLGGVKAKGFTALPSPLGLGASGDPALVRRVGAVVAEQHRAIGVRLVRSPSADLFTDPRWSAGEWTFGEDGAAVAALVAAYVTGLQGAALGPGSVASVVGHFPGAGAAEGGWDGRLAKGKHLVYPGGALDAHLAPFQAALAAGAAGVMPAYGIPQAGPWSGLSGIVQGSTIEQVGASFNAALLGGALRGHLGFGGLVLAPEGVLEDPGLAPLGAPWGVESLSRVERAAKAVTAGVDQFAGQGDPAPLAAALERGLITAARVDEAAGRALDLMFRLGLFEDPYVDPALANGILMGDAATRTAREAMAAAQVLLVNARKPVGWLDGGGDGTQVGDPYNAGNGTLRVLPAPPGTPYPILFSSFFVTGDFDLQYVRAVSAGYGTLNNDETNVYDFTLGEWVPVSTDAERIALSHYVFIRMPAPSRVDPESGALGLPDGTLEYAAGSAGLDDLAAARAAIDAWPGSRCQIVVVVDGGRPPVLDGLLAYGVSAISLGWGLDDKGVLDLTYGIQDGLARLPVGLPLSDAAAAAQRPDLAGDGQAPAYLRGAGVTTRAFQPR